MESSKAVGYVDIHTHLTDPRFKEDQDQVIERAIQAGLKAIVCNGLDHQTNLQILQLQAQYPNVIVSALGIYPVHAVHESHPSDLPYPVEPFSIKAEIASIEESLSSGLAQAVGECGLDGYCLPESTFNRQEEVFLELAQLADRYNVPLIVHTRNREKRTLEILDHHGIKKVNFHCFQGRSKLAIQAAEKHDLWFFSIPANAAVNPSFQNLLKALPENAILTETDAPYLSPVRNTRNEPANVVVTVKLFAELKSWDLSKAKTRIWNNYMRLFDRIPS